MSGQALLKALTSSCVLRQGAAYEIGGDVVVRLVLVDQDREQLLPDLVARLVVGSAGRRRLEGLGPVGGAEPDVGPVGLDLHARGRAAPRTA